jgi:hypothetical protein
MSFKIVLSIRAIKSNFKTTEVKKNYCAKYLNSCAWQNWQNRLNRGMICEIFATNFCAKFQYRYMKEKISKFGKKIVLSIWNR